MAVCIQVAVSPLTAAIYPFSKGQPGKMANSDDVHKIAALSSAAEVQIHQKKKNLQMIPLNHYLYKKTPSVRTTLERQALDLQMNRRLVD